MATSTMRAITRANTYYSDEEFERQERLMAQWQLCPLYLAWEGGGDCVFLDGCARPICRVFADNRVEFLEPHAEYYAIDGLHRLHDSFGIVPDDKAARDGIQKCISNYKMKPALRDRWERQQRGELTCGWGW